MQSIRIAAAQSVSVPGEVAANVATHMELIAIAGAAEVDVLLFPELSLSGYELPLLRDCTVHPEDARLAPIRLQAMSLGMIVIVGAAVSAGSPLPCIGAIIYFPDGNTAVYCKQYLHPGEERFAARGAQHRQSLFASGEHFSMAICADTAHEQHAKNSASTGAALYLASVLVSKAGYPVDAGNLCRYASSYGFGVLMANHGGPSGGYVSAGRSSFWAPGGELVVSAPGTGSCLVVASRSAKGWSGELLAAET